MTKRPVLFTTLSLAFFCYTPLTILYSMAKIDLPITWAWATLKMSFNSPYIYYYWLIPSLISLSLIKMRKYSFPIFILGQFLALALPFISKKLFIPELLAESALTVYALQAFAFFNLAYFSKKGHFNFFFNHATRPWEWATRIKTQIPISLKTRKTNQVIDAVTYNISTSGLLFAPINNRLTFDISEKVLVNISFADNEISLPVKVVRFATKDGYTCYGAKFNHRGIWQYFQLKKLISQLPKHRIDKTQGVQEFKKAA